MDDRDILPINIIVLDDYEKIAEDSISDYLDILVTCKKADEFRSLIQMIIHDTRNNTLREILTKDIQNKAKILEETKYMD